MKLDKDADNIYEVSITATDSEGNSANRDVEITVTNVNETPEFSSDELLIINMAENGTAVTTLAVADVDAGDDLTYTLTGDDAALFSVDSNGKISFIKAPDFENAKDADKDNSYEITVTVTDEGGLKDSRDIIINISDVEAEPTLYMSNIYHKKDAEFLVNTHLIATRGSLMLLFYLTVNL